MRPLSVNWLGKTSQDILAHPQAAVLIGVTSRGFFVRLETDWVVFLSSERLRGPLTLNLSGETSVLTGLHAGSPVEIEAGRIRIPSSGVEVDFSQASAWEAPPPPATFLSASDRLRSLQKVAGLILAQGKDPGLYLVLKALLGLEDGGVAPLPVQFERLDCLHLLELLRSDDLEAAQSGLTPFLGAGVGLTPSGDDLVLGLLLAYQRWGSVLLPLFDLEALKDHLQRVAAQKTTLLSVNLIACAALGQADERLVEGLDGIITGNSPAEKCALSLSAWGNTSGCDALVGMALAILSAGL
jgi:hypothetical protein